MSNNDRSINRSMNRSQFETMSKFSRDRSNTSQVINRLHMSKNNFNTSYLNNAQTPTGGSENKFNFELKSENQDLA